LGTEKLAHGQTGDQPGIIDDAKGQYVIPSTNTKSALMLARKSIHGDNFGRIRSLKKLRSAKDEIREHTMQKVSSMGLQMPIQWKDEIYKNELTKLDVKRELDSNQELKDGAHAYEFNLEQYKHKYFDESLKKNFRHFKKLLYEESKSKFSRMKSQNRVEPATRNPGAKLKHAFMKQLQDKNEGSQKDY